MLHTSRTYKATQRIVKIARKILFARVRGTKKKLSPNMAAQSSSKGRRELQIAGKRNMPSREIIASKLTNERLARAETFIEEQKKTFATLGISRSNAHPT